MLYNITLARTPANLHCTIQSAEREHERALSLSVCVCRGHTFRNVNLLMKRMFCGDCACDCCRITLTSTDCVYGNVVVRAACSQIVENSKWHIDDGTDAL